MQEHGQEIETVDVIAEEINDLSSAGLAQGCSVQA